MTSNMTKPDFDIAIIGGGPAGSSMACYLAKAGINCVVFETEIFPRPHVGESLVPAANRVLQELDLIEQMEEAGFVHKEGAAWTSSTGQIYGHLLEELPPDCKVDVRFDEREMQGSRNYSYHVDRGKFDQLLLQHAQKLGATVYEGVRVNRVDFPEGDYPELVVSINEQQNVYRVRLVVDASGRRTLLGTQLKLKIKDPDFNQFAIHTWFEGYDRGTSEKKNFIFVHFLPISNSWVWQIPISETITSFGVVTRKEHFAKKKQEREQFFWDCVSTHPEVFENLKQAQQLRPFKEEGDYSYAMKKICGDGWVLIGDAARFVDPIFSSGVSVALNSARLASQDIINAFQQSSFKNGILRREDLRDYETTLRRGTKIWYKLISLYYRLNILFTIFVDDPRYRLDVLKLLSGDVYDEEEPQVLREMTKLVTEIEQNPNHPWHKMLGDLTITDQQSLQLVPNNSNSNSLNGANGQQKQNGYVAPSNSIEQSIANIWQDSLKISQVGIHDNFFYLGGESIIALQIIDELRKTLQVKVSLKTFVETPTIAALAQSIASTSGTTKPSNGQTEKALHSPLVAINSEGSKPPLFCIHPVTGNVISYLPLLRHLGSEQPVYGLQSTLVNEKDEPLTKVEEMAADYIKAIQAIQPEGPYFLAGWSFGGLVAFEMATQLQRQGQKIARLFLIDVAVPLNSTVAELDDTTLMAVIGTEISASARADFTGFLDTLQGMPTESQLPYILELAKQEKVLPAAFELKEFQNMVKVFKTNLLALYSYVPQVYSDQITLFRSSELLTNYTKFFAETFSTPKEPALGWDEFSLKPVEVHKVPGNHFTLLAEPQVQVLGDLLRGYLDNVQLSASPK